MGELTGDIIPACSWGLLRAPSLEGSSDWRPSFQEQQLWFCEVLAPGEETEASSSEAGAMLRVLLQAQVGGCGLIDQFRSAQDEF